MVYKFDARQAPRVFLLPATPVLILGGTITLFAVGQPLIGIIALAVGGWISYHLVRYTVLQFRSQVRASDDELVCVTSFGAEARMEWASVTHSGIFTTEKAGTYLFVYNESEDELLSVPPHYTDWHQLQELLRSRAPGFMELSGKDPDSLGAALRPYLEVETNETDSTTQ